MAGLKFHKFITIQAKFLYHLSRGLTAFRLRYNRAAQRIERDNRPAYARYLYNFLSHALFIVTSLQLVGTAYYFLSNYFKILVLKNGYTVQAFHTMMMVGVVKYWNSIRVLAAFFNPSTGRLLQRLLQEVLLMRRELDHLTHIRVAQMPHCKHLLYAQVLVTLINITNTNPSMIFLETVISGYYMIGYYAYQTMQLTLWTLQHHINICIAVLNAHPPPDHASGAARRGAQRADRRNMRRLQRLIALMRRLRKLHLEFTSHFAWFPQLVFSRILINISYASDAVVCIFQRNSYRDYALTTYPKVVSVFADVALLGYMHDAIREQDNEALDLLMIAVGERFRQQCRCRYCHGLQQKLELQFFEKQLRPFELYAYRGVHWNRGFVFEFIITALLHSLTFAQFDIAFREVSCLHDFGLEGNRNLTSKLQPMGNSTA